MASCVVCGPKLAACGIVLSLWGVIMLVLLGVFFKIHSAVLIDDVPFQEGELQLDSNPPSAIYKLYDQVGYNCFIAAAVYVILGLLSICQLQLIKRKALMLQ